MSLPKASPKRQAAIDSGEVRRVAGSSFVMSAEQFRAYLVRKKSKARKSVEEGKGPQTRSLGPKTDKQRWKVKAIKYFSEFIRLRDSGADGYGTCVTCPRTAHWRTMDAGHFISCAREATRFDESNVHLQCKGCNRFQGGKFLQHEVQVDRRHGQGTARKLKDKAFLDCRRDEADYRSIAETYKFHVDRIKQHEPEKYNSPNRK